MSPISPVEGSVIVKKPISNKQRAASWHTDAQVVSGKLARSRLHIPYPALGRSISRFAAPELFGWELCGIARII
jgi:hypothetical protein